MQSMQSASRGHADIGAAHRTIRFGLGRDERVERDQRTPPRRRRQRQVPALGKMAGDDRLQNDARLTHTPPITRRCAVAAAAGLAGVQSRKTDRETACRLVEARAHWPSANSASLAVTAGRRIGVDRIAAKTSTARSPGHRDGVIRGRSSLQFRGRQRADHQQQDREVEREDDPGRRSAAFSRREPFIGRPARPARTPR